jgi:hypothetical protein
MRYKVLLFGLCTILVCLTLSMNGSNGIICTDYSATYSFTDDIVGTAPQGFVITEHPPQCTVRVVDCVGGHHMVVKINDTSSTYYSRMKVNFTPQVTGSIDFYARVQYSTTEDFYTAVDFSSNTTLLFDIAMFSSSANTGRFKFVTLNPTTYHILQWVNGTYIHAINNTWHHIAVNFNCRTNTWHVAIDGQPAYWNSAGGNISTFPFRVDAVTLSGLLFVTPASVAYTNKLVYLDAINLVFPTPTPFYLEWYFLTLVGVGIAIVILAWYYYYRIYRVRQTIVVCF